MPRLVAGRLKGPFTVDDYYRMAEVGVLQPDARVELLDGMVVEMSPIGSPHASCVNRLTRLITGALGDQVTLSIQNPVRLSRRSEPQPDVAVLKPRRDGYAASHPGPPDVLLLVEVTDTTVRKDRELKMPLYARALIPEVWLVRLDRACIEIHREPSGESYRDVRTIGRGETLSPALLPDLKLAAADILG